jgi:hypothetical protein
MKVKTYVHDPRNEQHCKNVRGITIKYNIIGGACMIFSRFRLQVGRSIESWHVDERNESMLINRKEERKTNHRNKKKA